MQNIETIGEKMLIVDLIEQENPRRKKVSRLEIRQGDLQQVLSERPHLAQLALFWGGMGLTAFKDDRIRTIGSGLTGARAVLASGSKP